MNMESDSSGDSPFTPHQSKKIHQLEVGKWLNLRSSSFRALEFDEKVFDDSFYSDRYRLLYLWLEAEFSYRRA